MAKKSNNVDISSISRFITPGKEKQAQTIANNVAKNSSGSSSRNTNSNGQTAPIGPNDQVTSSNYQSVLNYLSPYMTQSAQNTVRSGGQPVSYEAINQMINSPVTTADLTTPVTPIKYPETTPSPYTTDYTAPPVTPVTTPVKSEADKTKEIYDKYISDIKTTFDNGKSDMAGAYEESLTAIDKIKKNEDSIQAEINTISAQQQADVLAARNQSSSEGGTSGILSAREDAINRSAAIKLLPLEAKLAAAQKDTERAQERLQTLFDLKIKDAEINRDYSLKLAEATKDAATAEQKVRLDAADKADERQYDLFSSQIDQINRLSMQYAQDGNYTAATKLAEYAAGLDYKTFNPTKVAGGLTRIVSNYGGGSTETSGDWSSVVNGAYSLLGPTKGKQIRSDLNTQLNSGDYAGAYATLGNAVEEALTGTNKTKFSDARTDYQVMSGLRTAIQNYSDAGGDMGLLTGTAESIKRKLGIDSGNASTLATQLWREFQSYRVNMTGAAFSPEESRDYASVNPTLGKSLNLNLSVIDGAMAQLENRITGTINARIPGAQTLFEKLSPQITKVNNTISNEDISTFDSVVGGKIGTTNSTSTTSGPYSFSSSFTAPTFNLSEWFK